MAGVGAGRDHVLARRDLGHGDAAEVRRRAPATSRPGGRPEPDAVARAGAADQLGRRAVGHQPAVVDDDDAVGEPLGLVEVVGGEQHGDAVVAQLGDDLADDLAPGRVDARGRLVEERHLGPADEREREGQALLLAAGQLPPGAALEPGQPEPVEQLAGSSGLRVEGGGVAQHLGRPQRRVDAALLQHHADALGQRPVVGDGVEPEHPHRPAAGRR